MGGLQTKSMTSQRNRAVKDGGCYYGNVDNKMADVTSRLSVLYKYSTSSTVQSWTELVFSFKCMASYTEPIYWLFLHPLDTFLYMEFWEINKYKYKSSTQVQALSCINFFRLYTTSLHIHFTWANQDYLRSPKRTARKSRLPTIWIFHFNAKKAVSLGTRLGRRRWDFIHGES